MADIEKQSKSLNDLGPLGEPDQNGLRLPAGFISRVVARSGKLIPPSNHRWHAAPDGGATFPTEDGGWIYVSNSEKGGKAGGAGALKFDSNGHVIDAYSILENTSKNCAGGPTPWGTWLSCEEISEGRVWECYPLTRQEAVERPALGIFKHEAVAVDPFHKTLYLTEDKKKGCFYRFRPDHYPDLSSGTLEVAQVIGAGHVIWHKISDPGASSEPTRKQVPESTHFKGGEGIWYHKGKVYFSTKRDNRVWAYDANEHYLAIIYDDDFFHAELTGVDNVTATAAGDVLVAEDGGDMQVVAITPERKLIPILQVEGHERSEVTGPAFDPSQTRLYFSSQRGASGESDDGVTFEVTGPFV